MEKGELCDNEMRLPEIDSLDSHLYRSSGVESHPRLWVNHLFIDEDEPDSRRDCCQDQEPFEFRERFTQAATSTSAEWNVSIRRTGSGRFVRKPLRIKSGGIRKPTWIAVKIPGANEGPRTGWQDRSGRKAVFSVR